jgi:biopolymer transport protein ExbD
MTKGELTMAPLIDIVLQQLIFFMLTSSFVMQPGIRINLPAAVTTEPVKLRQVFVSVSERGAFFFNERAVTLPELGRLLAAEARADRDTVLVIKGDRSSRHGDIVKVMDEARRAGITRMAIGTMPATEE